ncbi:DUF2207 domain-containing protein [Agrococcus baldri]|uniref:Multidrug ABC transporter ATPase n=1 Tax=Agrococcus baldri TaxID=153730 RepID=A0AA87RBQ8_9MICO|nr:DUF2207 domain-containing protein [Agrococcus baldri]GEK79762.1 hypothetical protein ABA31_11130 [Agrococcus baldri]
MPKASSNPTQRPKRRAPQPAPETRSGRDAFERILAVGVVVFAAIAVLGFAATLLHVAFRDGNPFFAGVAWQYAYWLPLLALPIMIVLIVTLIISSARGKARTHRA